jgi:hypothetical protein
MSYGGAGTACEIRRGAEPSGAPHAPGSAWRMEHVARILKQDVVSGH